MILGFCKILLPFPTRSETDDLEKVMGSKIVEGSFYDKNLAESFPKCDRGKSCGADTLSLQRCWNTSQMKMICSVVIGRMISSLNNCRRYFLLLENMGEMMVTQSQLAASENQSSIPAVWHNHARTKLSNILQPAPGQEKFVSSLKVLSDVHLMWAQLVLTRPQISGVFIPSVGSTKIFSIYWVSQVPEVLRPLEFSTDNLTLDGLQQGSVG